jgi:uncharacterized protein
MTKDNTNERTTLKRLCLSRRATDAIPFTKFCDQGFVCHVGFTVNAQPVVLPTAYGQAENALYIHGSVASRILRTLVDGIQACVTLTLLNGLLLARSAYSPSTLFPPLGGSPRAR